MGNRKSYGQKEQLPRAHLCLVLNDLGMVCVWKPHSPCLFPLEWISAPLSVPAPGCSAQASPRPCWGDGAEQPLDGRQAPAQRLGCSAWGPEWLRGLREFGGLRELGGWGVPQSPSQSPLTKSECTPISAPRGGGRQKPCMLALPLSPAKRAFCCCLGGCLFAWGKRQKRLNFRIA